MSTRQELESDISALGSALKAADDSGDTARATKLAKAYKKAKSRLDLMVSNPGEYDPQSEEFQAKYGATAGMSGLEKFIAGWDKGASDLALGAQQIAANVGSILPMNPAAWAVANMTKQRLQQESANRAERDAPLNKGAGLAGQVTSNIATLAPLGVAAGTIPRAIGLGALEGALRPSATDSEAALNIGVGGVSGLGGELLGRGLQRAVTPFAASHSARAGDAVDLLRREGVDLDVAQRSGNQGAQRLRSTFGDNPITANRQSEFTNQQLKQYTRAVLRRIGVNADEATPDVLNRATREIGNKIDDALASSPPVFDTELAAAIQEVQRSIPRTLTGDAAQPILKNIEDIFKAVDPQTGIISPAQFTQIRAKLSALRRSTPAAGDLASDLEDALLAALERSGGNRAGLSQALAQWRNFRIIEGALDKGTDKFISPARLSNTMNNIRNRAVALRHLGHPETVELARLAEAGRELLPETIGNSGTWGRALAGQGVLGVGAGGAAFATGQDVGDAAAIGLGAATLPMLLQRGMLSQGLLGNYLAQGASPALQGFTNSPVTQSLIRQGVISQGLMGQ